MTLQIAYAVSFALGSLVGIGELAARYRDAPLAAVRAPGALVYVGINGLASLSALWLARTFGVGGGSGAEQASVLVTQTLLASFAAIAFFRTSLFVTKVGDQDVGIGPSSMLAALLGAADRSVDRTRAAARSRTVSKVMEPVSFDLAQVALPTFCLALLQNASDADQSELARTIKAIKQARMSDRQKSLALGLTLMNMAGSAVLESAVTALGVEIRRGAETQ